MVQSPRRYPQRKLKLIFGLVLAAILYVQYQLGQENEVVVRTGSPIVLAAQPPVVDPFERMIREDPLSALRTARERHLQLVRDYECVLIKQEVLPSGMSTEQEIAVKFRQAPYSVMMSWLRNPGMAHRVIYVKDRWIDPNPRRPEERDLAVAQPGPIAQIFVKSLKQPIRGKLARKSSRRFLDEFGFGRTLDLLIKYCELARSRHELSLAYKGETYFDGRPVWVIRRTLPYSGPNGEYPDRTAEIFIDKELRIPVAVYCYSDEEKKPDNLLGKYEYRNIRFDVGLTDQDFEPKTYGM